MFGGYRIISRFAKELIPPFAHPPTGIWHRLRGDNINALTTRLGCISSNVLFPGYCLVSSLIGTTYRLIQEVKPEHICFLQAQNKPRDIIPVPNLDMEIPANPCIKKKGWRTRRRKGFPGGDMHVDKKTPPLVQGGELA
jgi:hypothetical protein